MGALAMILHIPHASRIIPAAVRNQFLLTDTELDRELLMMTDAYTDELFCADLAPSDTAVVFPVSRLVVDPERFADDAAEPMANRGMGVIYTTTHDGRPLRRVLAPEEKQALLDTYYFPHHQRVSEAVDKELNATGTALLVDCHSFPSAPLPCDMDQSPDRPQICIGTDSFHTPSDVAELLVQYFRAAGLTVELDRPFAGSIVPVAHYRRDARVVSVMIEINRAVYMDESTGAKLPHFEDAQNLVVKAVRCLKEYHTGRSMKATQSIQRPWSNRRSHIGPSKLRTTVSQAVRQTQAMMAIRRKLDGKETNDEQAT